MSQILTSEPPKHHGERRVYDQVSSQEQRTVFYWFALDFIPGVNDIDMLIWDVESGVFVVEIKAVDLNSLQSISYSKCEIKGRGITKSPQSQAYGALLSLRNFISPRLSRVPFLVATVAWPLISREEWKSRFRDNVDISNLADRMLMSEDIFSSAAVISSRLRKIWNEPPIRRGADGPFRHNRDEFSKFRSILDPTISPLASATDEQRLIAFENSVRREILRGFPVGSGRKVIFQGYPGTGKTFRLLQIAISHAREGANVLLTCFNQVLASELQRIVNLLHLRIKQENGESSLKQNLLVLDITTLATEVLESEGLKIAPGEYDEWGRMIVEEFSSRDRDQNLMQFDTILVDEAQDFSDWQLELVNLMLHETSTIAYGLGNNQELYRGHGRCYMNNLSTDASIKRLFLKRNFRNNKPIYILATLFLETELSELAIPECFSRNFKPSPRVDLPVDFELSTESFPRLCYVDDLCSGDFTEPNFFIEQTQKLEDFYTQVLQDELSGSGDSGDSRDILLLVPSSVCEELIVLRRVLARLREAQGIQYLDLVARESRKVILPPHHIRLVSFHSARGLEAKSVIVFGIEGLFGLARATSTSPGRLAYILLSRAIFKLSICLRSSRRNSTVEFLEKSVEYLQEHYNQVR
jgi:hypothetical protein